MSSGRPKRKTRFNKTSKEDDNSTKRTPPNPHLASQQPSPKHPPDGADSDLGAKAASPAAEARPDSPEPTCSICLGKVENKSFTDSCFHTFCFVCLMEWSKVKAVCPLCKQPFKSIIHNVRSIEDYDQYHLKPEDSGSFGNPDGRRFRYRTTMTLTRHIQRPEGHSSLHILQMPFARRSHWAQDRAAATSNFRRRVYTNGMRVERVETAAGRPSRLRNITPEFFTRYPASTHRLVPWLNRELNVLLHHHENHVQFVLELIMDLVKRFHIQSEEFLEHIQPFFGRRTDHFIHEFYHFARSPYDMISYDRFAVYNEVQTPVETVEDSSDSSEGNDSDVILLSPENQNAAAAQSNNDDSSPNNRPSAYNSLLTTHNPEPPAERRHQFEWDLTPLLSRVRHFLTSANDTSLSGWDSPTPGPSSIFAERPRAASPTPVIINDAKSEDERRKPHNSNGESPSSGSVYESHSHKSEDTDHEDIIIVGYDKPWASRTPIQLSSDDDNKDFFQKNAESRRHKSSRQDRSSKRHRSGSHKRHRDESHSDHRSYTDKERSDRHLLIDSGSHYSSRHHRNYESSGSHSRSNRRSRSGSSTRPRSRSSRSRSLSHSKRSTSKRRWSSKFVPRTESRSPRLSLKLRLCKASHSRDSSVTTESNYDRSREVSKLSSAHRRSSSESVEFLVEKKRKKKHRKSKKHKKHKKHKSQHHHRRHHRHQDESSGSDVEIIELDNQSNNEEEAKKYKKNPTGHKKSSKTAKSSDGLLSDPASGVDAEPTTSSAGSAQPASQSVNNENASSMGMSQPRPLSDSVEDAVVTVGGTSSSSNSITVSSPESIFNSVLSWSRATVSGDGLTFFDRVNSKLPDFVASSSILPGIASVLPALRNSEDTPMNNSLEMDSSRINEHRNEKDYRSGFATSNSLYESRTKHYDDNNENIECNNSQYGHDILDIQTLSDNLYTYTPADDLDTSPPQLQFDNITPSAASETTQGIPGESDGQDHQSDPSTHDEDLTFNTPSSSCFAKTTKNSISENPDIAISNSNNHPFATQSSETTHEMESLETVPRSPESNDDSVAGPFIVGPLISASDPKCRDDELDRHVSMDYEGEAPVAPPMDKSTHRSPAENLLVVPPMGQSAHVSPTDLSVASPIDQSAHVSPTEGLSDRTLSLTSTSALSLPRLGNIFEEESD